VVAASSDDGHQHGVVGICPGCVRALERTRNNPSLWGAFLARALADPNAYAAKFLPDIGLAELAVALVGHPDWARETLDALQLLD
jgi:hypothetical protein